MSAMTSRPTDQTDETGHAALAGLVLAAGGGTRFAGAKQLAEFGGQSLVCRITSLASKFCGAGVVVVTGAYAADVGRALAGTRARVAFNPDWQAGLSASIRCGLARMPEKAVACMILLCDQVLVDEADLGALLQGWQAAPQEAAAAAYAGGLGVPAIFPARLWPRLESLGGDRGARDVLAGLQRVTAVAMPHAATDVDTVADLRALPESWGALPPADRPV